MSSSPPQLAAAPMGQVGGRDDLSVLNDPIEQRRFTRFSVGPGGVSIADSSLRISGMHCAACAGIIENALDDGRSTLAARSRSAIAMQRRPLQRFQLLAQQPAADKVLVKRLPVASAGQLHMETIDGVRTLVSEIFVNR